MGLTEEGDDGGIGLGRPRHSARPKRLVGWNGTGQVEECAEMKD
jgi:hypothetical protein